ncbi:hypothetical protein Hanom_Chr04g00372421 [Helianthus anomalus]
MMKVGAYFVMIGLLWWVESDCCGGDGGCSGDLGHESEWFSITTKIIYLPLFGSNYFEVLDLSVCILFFCIIIGFYIALCSKVKPQTERVRSYLAYILRFVSSYFNLQRFIVF